MVVNELKWSDQWEYVDKKKEDRLTGRGHRDFTSVYTKLGRRSVLEPW
jgi:hypothetical protein